MATNAKNLAELLNTDTTVKVGDVEDGSINADKLASTIDLSSKTVTLPNGVVDTGQIADNAITALKLNITGNGTSGQFLKTDGDGSFDYIDAPTVQTPTQQIFTTVGTSTWTRPTGCTKVKVTVIGGGGGAGGNFTKANFNGHVGINGAGGGGGTSIKLLDVSSIASVEVTVGAGGNGGGSTSNGSAGGTSSFGTYATANGGGGGYPCGLSGSQAASTPIETFLGLPGIGGTAADGDLNLKGEDGHLPARDNGDTFFSSGHVTGPRGGQAAGLSAGNARGIGSFSSQQAAGGGSAGEANTGNGGQSVAANRTNYASTGAAGGSGIVIVDEFYS